MQTVYKIYDYAPEFLKDYEKDIRKRFIEKCKKDDTLSDAYKEHVSNPDNVKIRLKPVYSYDIYAWLSYLSLAYQYDTIVAYATTYSTQDGYLVNGTSHSYETHKYHYLFHETTAHQCCVHFGENLYYSITKNKTIPSTWREVNKTNFVPDGMKSPQEVLDYFRKNINVKALPKEFRTRAEEEIKNECTYEIVPFTFKFTGISDYQVGELYAYFFPTHCKFDISVCFGGKEYTLKDLTSIDGIASNGEKSAHYTRYVEEATKIISQINNATKPDRRKFSVMFILYLSGFIGLILLSIFSNSLGYVNLYPKYTWSMLGIILVTLVMFFILLVYSTGEISTEEELNKIYQKDAEIHKLRFSVKMFYENKAQRSLSSGSKWFVISIILAIVFAIAVINMLSKSQI